MPAIIAEFPESEFQSHIERVLIQYFSGRPMVDIIYHQGAPERKRGYDIEVQSLIPMYLQIKRANFVPAFSDHPLLSSRKKFFGITDKTGCYYFSLHRDQKTSTYKQQKLLYILYSKQQYARYIAPLFHTRDKLKFYKYHVPEMVNANHKISLFDLGHQEWVEHRLIPDTVAIIPYKIVSENPLKRHRYAYNHNRSTSFHSDPEKVDGSRSLFGLFHYMFRRYFENGGQRFQNILTTLIESIIEAESDLELEGGGSPLAPEESNSGSFLEYLKTNFNSNIQKPNLLRENVLRSENRWDLYKYARKYISEKYGIQSYMLGV